MTSTFSGFPAQARFISIPEAFITTILPGLNDTGEIKTALYIMRVLYLKRSYPRFVTGMELEFDRDLIAMLGGLDKLQLALTQSVQHGALLHLAIQKEGRSNILYFLNDETSRQAVEKIKKGQLALGEFASLPAAEPLTEPISNIFSLYENNIGLITPMVADELKEAEKLYPALWIEAAFKEAVTQNKRRWSYISRILERWATEGRGDGTTGGNTKKDPDKYIKGRYGHIVRR